MLARAMAGARRKVGTLKASVRYRLRWGVERLPRVYCWIARMRGARRNTVTSDSRILVEGFPRSGNSWLAALAAEWLGSDGAVASHLHSAAHVKRARQLHVPSVVVCRNPADAVASFRVFDPTIPTRTMLLHYLGFHRRAIGMDGVTFVSFEDAVGPASLRVLEDILGPSPCARNWQALAERTRERVDLMSQRADNLVVSRVGRPSSRRQPLVAAEKAALSLRHPGLLVEAEGVYEDVLRRCASQ